MTVDGEAILRDLRAVQAERLRRSGDPALDARVAAVKAFQHGRFQRSYADLLVQGRYARATRFFLEELYGPGDFTRRDDQFARIVPALCRLFPGEIVSTVRALAALHALSEQLDTAMGAAATASLAPAEATLSGLAYQRLWQQVGEPALRQRQIDLMVQIGSALDRYTRNPLLRHSLKLMRGPARAAGLETLQTFLEAGFETFREMRGADEFLRIVASRERALSDALFAGLGPLR